MENEIPNITFGANFTDKLDQTNIHTFTRAFEFCMRMYVNKRVFNTFFSLCEKNFSFHIESTKFFDYGDEYNISLYQLTSVGVIRHFLDTFWISHVKKFGLDERSERDEFNEHYYVRGKIFEAERSMFCESCLHDDEKYFDE